MRANGRNIVGCYMLGPFAHPVAFCWMLLCFVAQSLKPVKLLAPCKRAQHCWPTSPTLLKVTFASVCTPCCILLDVVACFRAKFETCQTFSTVQTGAPLIDVICCVLLHTLLHFVGCSCVLLGKV